MRRWKFNNLCWIILTRNSFVLIFDVFTFYSGWKFLLPPCAQRLFIKKVCLHRMEKKFRLMDIRRDSLLQIMLLWIQIAISFSSLLIVSEMQWRGLCFMAELVNILIDFLRWNPKFDVCFDSIHLPLPYNFSYLLTFFYLSLMLRFWLCLILTSVLKLFNHRSRIDFELSIIYWHLLWTLMRSRRI